ncbi:MAG: hypothetical protein R3F11_07675 [Verrucomicrobiales bacterium]
MKRFTPLARPSAKGMIAALAASALLWLSASPSGAGFSDPRKGIVGVSLLHPDMVELAKHAPFDTMNDAERTQRIGEIREQFADAIALLKKNEPKLGACLEEIYKKGGICLEFQKKARSSGMFKTDAPGCGGVRINIGKFPANPKNVTKDRLFESNGLVLLNALAFEACRALEPTSERLKKKTGPEKTKAKAVDACARMNCYQKAIPRLQAIQAVMRGIVANVGAALPADASGIAKDLGEQLLNDPALPSNLDRAAAAQSAEKRLRGLIATMEKKAKEWATRKKAFEDQLALAPQDRNANDMFAVGWSDWISEQFEAPDGSGNQILIEGGGADPDPDGIPGAPFITDPTVRNVVFTDAEAPIITEISFPGVTSLTGFLLEIGVGMYAVGHDETSGQGAIFHVADTDGNGTLDGAVNELFRSPAFYGGAIPLQDPNSTDVIFVHKGTRFFSCGRESLQMGLPGSLDTFFPCGNMGPSESFVNFAEISGDGQHIFCGEVGSDLVLPGFSEMQCNLVGDFDGDGFVGGADYQAWKNALTNPAIIHDSYPGDEFARVSGVPGADCAIIVDYGDGSGPQEAGTGCLGAGGYANIPIAPALPPGATIQVFDTTNALAGEPQAVVNGGDGFPVAEIDIRSPDHYALNVSGGKRFAEIKVEYGATNVWQSDPRQTVDLTLNGSGGGTLYAGPPDDPDSDGILNASADGALFRGVIPPPFPKSPPPFLSDPLPIERGNGITIQVFPDDYEAGTFERRNVQLVDPPEFVGSIKGTGTGEIFVSPSDTAPAFSLTVAFDTWDDQPSQEVTINIDPVTNTSDEEGIDAVDPLTGEPFKIVRCLSLYGQAFPAYQFHEWSSGNDACKPAHWHSNFFVVRSLEFPLEPVVEPDNPCGFGWRLLIPIVYARLSIQEWNDFKGAVVP